MILKNQTSFYGITPLYFALMQMPVQNEFKSLIERENVEVSMKFVNSLIEINKLVETHYQKEPTEQLSEEDRKLIFDKTIATTLIYINDKCLRLHLPDLIANIEAKSLKTLVDVDVKIGDITLSEFLNYDNRGKNDFVQGILKRYSNQSHATSLEAEEKRIKELEGLLENVSIAVDLVSRRIERYENTTPASQRREIEFNSIMRDVEKIDSDLFKQSAVRQKLSSIGLDVSMCARRFQSCESAVRKLKGSRYNFQRAMPLVYTKETLERLKMMIANKIQSFKEGTALPRIFF